MLGKIILCEDFCNVKKCVDGYLLQFPYYS
jgi:hypothetical protein